MSIERWTARSDEGTPFFGVERTGFGRFAITLHEPWRPWILRRVGSLLVRFGCWLNPWERF